MASGWRHPDHTGRVVREVSDELLRRSGRCRVQVARRLVKVSLVVMVLGDDVAGRILYTQW